MTQITHIRTASTRPRGDFDRLTRPPALVSAVSSLLGNLLQALASMHRHMLASRQQDEAFERLNQLDEHQLHDIGLVRVEEVVGWRITMRGAAPVAVIRYSYRALPGIENSCATTTKAVRAQKRPASN